MTDQTAVDRIPLTHSVRYVARGLPDVPYQYGRGVLRPSEITLTYRAAPDSQLGRVHAYVAGRLWVDGAEVPHAPYGQHYDSGMDNWPDWLTEEARLHDPVSSAVAQSAPAETALVEGPQTVTHNANTPAARGDLRAENAKLIRWHREDGDALTDMRATIARLRDELKQQAAAPTVSSVGQAAHTTRDAVLSAAERAMLTYALDQAQERIWSEGGFTDEDQAAVTSLRRMADETQPAEAVSPAYARLQAAAHEAAEAAHLHAMHGMKRAFQLARRYGTEPIPAAEVLDALGLDENANTVEPAKEA